MLRMLGLPAGSPARRTMNEFSVTRKPARCAASTLCRTVSAAQCQGRNRVFAGFVRCQSRPLQVLPGAFCFLGRSPNRGCPLFQRRSACFLGHACEPTFTSCLRGATSPSATKTALPRPAPAGAVRRLKERGPRPERELLSDRRRRKAPRANPPFPQPLEEQ